MASTPYSVGTITVPNGGTTVTGTETYFIGSVRQNDMLFDPVQGLMARVTADPTSDTELSITPWAGTSLTDAAYEIIPAADTTTSSARLRDLLAQMSVVQANSQGMFYKFSDTTTDADPGAGYFRLNNADPALATAIYIDNLNANGGAMGDIVDKWDDSTSLVKGTLIAQGVTDKTIIRAYSITGSVVDGTGYRKLTGTYDGGSGSLAADDEFMLAFVRTGDQGDGFAYDTTVADPSELAALEGEDAGYLAFVTDLETDFGAYSGRSGVVRLIAGPGWELAAIYTGPKGDQGEKGAQWESAWASATVYAIDDITRADGSAYICLEPHTSGTFATDLAAGKWELFVEKGGTGATGATGGGLKGIACRVVATTNVAIATELEAADTIDGVTLSSGDLVLLTAQTDPEDNGVYIASVSGAAARHTDFDAWDDFPGSYFPVNEGTANADTLWRCTSNAGGTMGTTALVFEEFSAGGGDVGSAADFAALRALDGDVVRTAILYDDLRGGTFTWDSGDLSSPILGASIASSSVDSGTETITSVAHGLKTGDAAVVTGAVNGLSTNTIYYVIRVAADTFRLASSWANAQAGTAFNLTGTAAMTVRQHFDPLQGIFVTPDADITGASGAWKREFSGSAFPRWFGAAGTGLVDDSHPVQCAVDVAQHRIAGNKVYLTAHNIGATQYNVNYTIRITRSVAIEGEHNGVVLYYDGAIATTPIIWSNGLIYPNLENVSIKHLTLWSNTTNRADGIYFDNTSFIKMEDVILRQCRKSITLATTAGTPRSFSNKFVDVHVYNGTVSGVEFGDNFAGGAQHNFHDCSFMAPIGFYGRPTANLRALNLFNCSFELCTTTGFLWEGSASGINFHGGYCEKNAGVSSIQIAPASGRLVIGFNAFGVNGETDGESYMFSLGQASGGTLIGWSINGCTAEDYSVSLIRYYVDAASGRLENNILNNTAVVTNAGPATDVAISNNRNSTGSISA